MGDLIPIKIEDILQNYNNSRKDFEGLGIDGRIDELSNIFNIKKGLLTPEDIILRNYSPEKNNSHIDAHILVEKKVDNILYKLISVPAMTLQGEKIFRNLKIKVPIDKEFGDRVDYTRFCRELSYFATGHGHKDHIHGMVVGDMAHRYLMFLNEFLKFNNDKSYERLRTTLFEVINKKEGYFEQLLYGAMLHDIGKCLIPEDILNIKRKPNLEELEIIKKHPDYGELITRGIPGIEMTNHITKYHHEGWNGKGYEGLEGEEINLSSRITGLVDKVDALFSSRSYRTTRYSSQKVRDLFVGECSDERGNFKGSLDPQIEQILFGEKISIIEDGKRRLVDAYKVCFEDHKIIRDREERLAA